MINLDGGINEYTYQEILDLFHITALNKSLRNAFEYEMGKISKYWKIGYYDNHQRSQFLIHNILTSSELEMQINYCISKGAPNNKIYLYTIPERYIIATAQVEKIKNNMREKFKSIL